MEHPEKAPVDAAHIDVAPDGPYLVIGAGLTDSTGASVATKPKFALCRCGGSATKPFCDGTHKRNGFSGANQSDPAKRNAREYAGERITVTDRRWLCSHAAECLRGLPEVFQKGGRPWITPDAGDGQALIEVIERCPSGALDYISHESGDASHAAPSNAPPQITVEKNGPYHVTGAPILRDPSGLEPPVAQRYVLCRCGQSKNKPFCDGSHSEAQFRDDVG